MFFSEEQINFAIEWWCKQLEKKPSSGSCSTSSSASVHNALHAESELLKLDKGKSLGVATNVISMFHRSSAVDDNQLKKFKAALRQLIENTTDYVTQSLSELDPNERAELLADEGWLYSNSVHLTTDYAAEDKLLEAAQYANIKPEIFPYKTRMMIMPNGEIHIHEDHALVEVISTDQLKPTMSSSSSLSS